MVDQWRGRKLKGGELCSTEKPRKKGGGTRNKKTFRKKGKDHESFQG